MEPASAAQVSASHLSFEWPNGNLQFSDLSFSFSKGRSALVGVNGAGKTTLAKILSGEMRPTSGELRIEKPVRYLAQDEKAPLGMIAAEYLSSLWDSPTLQPELWTALLDGISLEKELHLLSGGEWVRVRIAHALTFEGQFLILDEPTNNLDKKGKKALFEFIKNYRDPILIISHDRELLNLVDQIYELSSLGMKAYQGNYDVYEEQKRSELHSLESKIEHAKKEKKKAERAHSEKLRSQEKRIRKGDREAKKGGIPRIVAGGLKRKAQETLGRIQTNEAKRSQRLKEELKSLNALKEESSLLYLKMKHEKIPEGKILFELNDVNVHFPESSTPLWRDSLSWTAKGPIRIAIEGGNGAGKSTLIKILTAEMERSWVVGEVKPVSVPTAVLDQEYKILNNEKSVLENVYESTDLDEVECRNQLALFQFTKDQVFQKVESLSGGEKLKAALAKILLSSPPFQLLILDEPTNNLDLPSLKILEGALNQYEGALIVISHDQHFLANIGVTGSYVLI